VKCKGLNRGQTLKGPSPIAFFGNALSLIKKEIHHYLHETSLQHDKMFLLWLGMKPIVVVHHVDGVKIVLQTKASHFEKGFFVDIMKPLVGEGLLTSEGEKWKLHHKLASSSFQPTHYKESLEGMTFCVKELISKWQTLFSYADSGNRLSYHRKERNTNREIIVDICDEMSRLTLDNIGIAVFGENFNAISNDQLSIYNDVEIVLREMQARAQQIYPIYRFLPFLFGKYQRSINKIREIVRQKIERRKHYLQNNNKELINEQYRSSGGILRNDRDRKRKYRVLLDVMLEASLEDRIGLSKEEIEDEMLTWVMGGHETTASMLSWTFYVLNENPEIENNIIHELHNVLGLEPYHQQHSNDTKKSPKLIVPSFEDLQKMHYLTMVLKEVLRMYPSAPLLNRVSIMDCEVLGYRIPKGTEILLSPWLLHRDATYWKDPERFDPMRFQEETTERNHGFHYLPFGAGPRACLGKSFALLEGKLVLSMLLQRFSLIRMETKKIESQVAITLRAAPNTMRFQLIPRDSKIELS